MGPCCRQSIYSNEKTWQQGWDSLASQDGESNCQIKLVRIVRRQKRVLERARYLRRASNYANHLYSDHQHIILLALREHFRKSYRDFCGLIEACTVILNELGPKKVPHFTTLQKFSKRAGMRRLERLLFACLDEARLRVLQLSVDSTSFISTSARTYYVRAFEVRKDGLGRPRRGFLMRRYVKQTMAAKMKRQLIVAVRFCMGPANDSPEFAKVLEKIRLAGHKVKIVMADKGYDAEKNHQYVREVLGTRTMIPLRAAGRPGVKVWGGIAGSRRGSSTRGSIIRGRRSRRYTRCRNGGWGIICLRRASLSSARSWSSGRCVQRREVGGALFTDR